MNADWTDWKAPGQEDQPRSWGAVAFLLALVVAVLLLQAVAG